MTQTDLNHLERNVEDARERLSGDLQRLRSPATLSGFKDALWAEADESRGQLIAKTKGTVDELAAKTKEGAGEIVARAGEIAGSVKERVERWSADTGQTIGHVADAAKTLPDRGTETLYGIVQDAEERDKYLLGAAAVALVAAIGFAYQRSVS